MRLTEEIQENRLYTLPEVAEITGLPSRNLRDWAVSGQIRARKYGREWRMNGADVLHFIKHGTEVPTKEEP